MSGSNFVVLLLTVFSLLSYILGRIDGEKWNKEHQEEVCLKLKSQADVPNVRQATPKDFAEGQSNDL